MNNSHQNGSKKEPSIAELSFIHNKFSQEEISSPLPPKSNGVPEMHNFYIPSSDKGYFYKEGKILNKRGLGWFITGLFLVGDLVGGGLIALPSALTKFGLIPGLIFLIITAVAVTYSGIILGKSWTILQRRWPSNYIIEHCRKPYAEIAYRAIGLKAKKFVSIIMIINQFGVAVLYLLIPSQNISDFLKLFMNINISFCWVIVLLAIVLLPLMFLKSPQDFWGIVVFSMVVSLLSIIMILWGAGIDYSACSQEHHIPPFLMRNYFLGLGIFLFSYSGHAAFPTVQHDMLKPHHFKRSVIMAFIIMTIFYSPVAIMGYMTYGDSLRDSLINSIQTKWIQESVNMLITVHCILTLMLKFNPINQEFEERLHIPQKFGIKRVIIRSSTMLAVVFVAETVPRFGPLVDLIGGSTLTLTSLVFPCILYLYLITGEEIEKENKNQNSHTTVSKPINITILNIFQKTNKETLICCIGIIVFAVVGGLSATFSALKQLSYTHLVPPCYVSYFLHKDMSEIKVEGLTNCCGFNQNISIYGNASMICSKPELDLYT